MADLEMDWSVWSQLVPPIVLACGGAIWWCLGAPARIAKQHDDAIIMAASSIEQQRLVPLVTSLTSALFELLYGSFAKRIRSPGEHHLEREIRRQLNKSDYAIDLTDIIKVGRSIERLHRLKLRSVRLYWWMWPWLLMLAIIWLGFGTLKSTTPTWGPAWLDDFLVCGAMVSAAASAIQLLIAYRAENHLRTSLSDG